MIIYKLFILLLCAVDIVPEGQIFQDRFNQEKNAATGPHRLLQLMRSYYEEANNRIAEMNDMRFMYEESPQYEQGYVMGEIIERYKKVVENTHDVFNHIIYSAFDILKRIEFIQKLYFEVYHLVRIMHEIPQKYTSDKEFSPVKKATERDLWEAQRQIIDMEKRRKKEKRKLHKYYEKMRNSVMKFKNYSEYGPKKRPYNNWWPLDYGWEVDLPFL